MNCTVEWKKSPWQDMKGHGVAHGTMQKASAIKGVCAGVVVCELLYLS
jgi:hypothetical protein